MPEKPTTQGLKEPAAARVISNRESELLERINAGLPERKADRLGILNARMNEVTLTPEEHAELIDLVDESEQLRLNRVEAIVELARSRETTVPLLMQELGLGVSIRV